MRVPLVFPPLHGLVREALSGQFHLLRFYYKQTKKENPTKVNRNVPVHLCAPLHYHENTISGLKWSTGLRVGKVYTMWTEKLGFNSSPDFAAPIASR